MKKFFTLLLSLMICGAGFSQSTTLVISQVYGGAGCGTAGCSTYKNDYIEIFNMTNAPIDLTGYSIQYSSAAGTTWQVTNLTGSIAAKSYYLIAEGAGANGTNTIPTPDATGTVAMSATAGKVALVNSTTALSGACPAAGTYIDLVGYGSTASCFETAYAPAPSTANAIFRAGSGATDSNDNSADFTAAPANPRNSASAPLPIFLISFNAAKSGTANKVTWKVDCQSESVKFQIERSVNGRAFAPVYNLTATKAECANAFTFDDPKPAAGANYYRLKMIDVDNKSIYSNIHVVVNSASGLDISAIIPTIVSSVATINVASSAQTKIEWSIFNMDGRLVQKSTSSINIGENIINLNAANLAKGMYKVIAVTADGTRKTLTMIKQ